MFEITLFSIINIVRADEKSTEIKAHKYIQGSQQ